MAAKTGQMLVLSPEFTQALRTFGLTLEFWKKQSVRELKKSMRVIGTMVKREAKKRVPVDKNVLRQGIISSVFTVGSVTTVDIGTNVRSKTGFDYPCILGVTKSVRDEFGIDSSIPGVETWDRGGQFIGRIVPGDFVRTQTGEFREVLKTQSFLAIEKPNVVIIEVPWRRGENHKLAVSWDHPILTFRGRRAKWIVAGDLRKDDRIFTRIKSAEDTPQERIIPSKICEICGNEYLPIGWRNYQQQKYCNNKCRAVAFRNANPHIGMKRSEGSKKKMSESAIRKFEINPDLHPSILVSKKGYRTQPEQDVEDWLICRNLDFEKQFRIGRYIVDFLVPSENTIYEADGSFWHRNQKKDIERDSRILKQRPGTQIIHIHFFNERFSPELISNPISSVHYLSCNPGPETYASPTFFEHRPIIDIKRFDVKDIWSDQLQLKYYDLQVDGIHSFICNGLVVSNTVIEFGSDLIAGGAVKALGDATDITDVQAITDWPTKRKRGGSANQQMPWLRPAWSAVEPEAIALINSSFIPPSQRGIFK